MRLFKLNLTVTMLFTLAGGAPRLLYELLQGAKQPKSFPHRNFMCAGENDRNLSYFLNLEDGLALTVTTYCADALLGLVTD